MPTVVSARDLRKSYRVATKSPGLWSTIRSFAHREYRQVEAVRGVTFDIVAGEVVGFLGPNGAGKTTTMKMLSGLVHPTSGDVTVSGYRPYARERQFLRHITLVMGQKQQLLWDLPAADSLRINAAVYEVPPDETKRRIAELASMLELGDKLHQPVRKLSLGERMKVELLAALLHRPQVLFLDEPTIGLDVNAQASVRTFLREYNRRYGAAILLTSHYMADIVALCDRVLVIHEGILGYDGSLEALQAKLSPDRELKLETRTPLTRETASALAPVIEQRGLVTRFRVRRDDITRTMTEALARFEVTDLSVSDPPLDDVIGQLFRQGGAV
ncbi:MAG: ABC transporter ATP-binding protein [Myxococcota bacterium]